MAATLPDLSHLSDRDLLEVQFLLEQRQKFDQMSEQEQRQLEYRSKLEASQAAFFRATWQILEPGKELDWSWHYDLIGEYLEAVLYGQIRRLILNVPPRTAKSSDCTIAWPAWCWARKPTLRFLTASYSGDLSSDHSAKRRMLMESSWYQSLWPMEFARDTNRRDQYKNVSGGEMIATSPSATATGRGGDILIMDDAMSADEAKSETIRKARHIWFTDTFRGRLDDPAHGAIVLIEQRTHDDDMTGWLLRNEPNQWTHVSIPLVADESKEYSFPISHKVHERPVGDVLQPERFTPDVIATRRIHARTFATQDQQKPAPDSGIVFQREWWKFRKTPRDKYDQIITSWDFAVEGKADSDYNCGICFGKAGADIDVLDIFKKRLPFPQQQKALVTFARKHPYATRHLIEKKANGPAIIASLSSVVSGLIAVEPQGSKLQRADASTPECEAGNVYLIEAEWNHEFIESAAIFPNGANDDDIDAFAQGVNWLRGHNYSYGLLGFVNRQAEQQKAQLEEYMAHAKDAQSTMVKPDTPDNAERCKRCASASVRRIGNQMHCNQCGLDTPINPDAGLGQKPGNPSQMRKGK